MAFEYELPDVGEGVAEGEIVAWHVEPGDHVEEDEVLAEVETDKAVVDLPSPVNGTVRELHAEEGEMVAVGSVVVTLDVDGEAPDEAEEEAGTAGAGETASAEGGETEVPEGRVFAPPNVRRLARELGVDISGVEGSGPSGRITEGDVRAAAESDSDDSGPKSAVTKQTADDGSGPKSAVTEQTADDGSGPKSAVTKRTAGDEGGPKSAVTERTDAAATASADRDRTLAAPATRQLAEEHGIDIDTVPTEKSRDGEAFVEPEDIETYVEARSAAETADGAEAAASPEAGAEAASMAGSEGTTDRPISTEPYRGIRRTIGNQMQASSSTIPHATHHDEAVVEELVRTRAELKGRAEDRGIGLTYMPFVLKAVVAGLKEHPVMNTELDEDEEEIRYKEYYNVGIAVATDAGLMVPVIEDVDEKGILELAAEVSELAEKARERKIAPEEMKGGTFTITNFGAIGGEYATPIINHPETAILGLGAIEQRPTVADGEVVASHTLPLSLSIDHRVIDGAEAAQFTNTVIEYLENPTLLLLE